MATFVLVHPAWFGGWSWAKVAGMLRASGHDVHCPTLTGLGERAHLARPDTGLEVHIEDVVNLLRFERLEDVVLVAHSSGGPVVTGVADRTPDSIAQVVYLDAFVSVDGQSVFDIVPPERRPPMQELIDSEGEGWLLPRFAPPPWEEFLPAALQITDERDMEWVLPRLRPTPFRHFTEPLRLTRPDHDRPPSAYIRCLQWPNASFDRYAENARSTPGWSYYELPTSHVPYVTDPDAVHGLLVELIP